MIRKHRYVLAVPDLKRSASFYGDVLGFEIREIGHPGWRFFERRLLMAGECPDALPPSELGIASRSASLSEAELACVDPVIRKSPPHQA